MESKLSAKDLRIGNLYIGYSNNVESVNLDFFGMLNRGIEVDEIIRSPIELSEEWLLRMGFEFGYKDDLAGWFITIFGRVTLIVVEMTIGGFVTYIETNVGMGFNTVIASPDFVHSMQNLVFGFTQTELTIN